MSISAEAAPLACEHLVTCMEKDLGRVLQPAIRRAFLQVPRHLFIDAYYRQQGNRLAWDAVATPQQEEIYQNEPLVTKIDERGRPISSSSLPSVMAQQLEALLLQDHQRVLEIGAGTGYNAALIHELVPSGQIVSIEIDESLVRSARQHLSAAGASEVVVRTGDGAVGEPAFAPYDRLLATCGVSWLPRSWLAQLREGGLLIANVLLNLASVFLLLKKQGSSELEGHFLAIDAQYMEMHGPGGLAPYTSLNWSVYDAMPHQEVTLTCNLSHLLTHAPFAVLLHSQVPTLEKHLRWNAQTARPDVALFEHATQATVVVRGTTLVSDGRALLIERIQQCIALYEQLGCPTLEQYVVHIDDGHVFLMLNDSLFPLPLQIK